MSKKLKIMLAVVLSTILTVSGVVIASRGTSELKANESLFPQNEADVPVVFSPDGTNGTETAGTVDGAYNGEIWGQTGNGIIYYDANGNVVDTEAKAAFSLSKRATATEDPNVYNVTLQFVTKQTTTTTNPEAAATVLVIDRSGSMRYCAECGGDGSHKNSCIYYADNSVKDEQKIEYKWYIITYKACEDCREQDSHSSKCKYYVSNNVQDSQKRIAVAKTAMISFLNSYRGDQYPYANGIGRYVSLVTYSGSASVTQDWIDVSTEAGYNAVVSKINALSPDGATNTDDGLYNASSQLDKDTVKNIPTSMKNVVLLTDGIPTSCRNGSDGDGGSCSQTEYNATVNSATSVKTKSTLYTVCFGAANDIVRNNEKCGDFLANKIATSASTAFNADNTSELNTALAAITKNITDGLTGAGTTITDPMPEGITVDLSTITGGTYTDGVWSLGDPVVTTDGNVTYYKYTITYQVHVDADAAGYNDSEYHPVNGKTILNFPDGTSTPDIEFPVPGVTGQTTLYTVIFDKGEYGTLKDQNADGQVVYNNIKANAATPEYPAVTADEHYYFAGWNYSRAELVKDNTNKNGYVITFIAQYMPKTTIKFVGETASKAYNGLDQSISGIQVQGLPEGATWDGVTYAAAGHNASGNAYAGSFGKKEPVIKLGDVDISDHFEYEYETGSLTITPVQLKVTTPDASKVYDGTELAAAGTIEGFVNGEGEKVTFTTGADATEVVNVADTAEGNNGYDLQWNDVVSTNYTLVEDLGTLTITPAPVTVTIVGDVVEAKYDRKEHTASGYTVDIDNDLYTVNDFSLAEGTKTTASRIQSGRDVMGLAADKFTNKNANFDVTFKVTNGYVMITKESNVTVQIKGNTVKETYNGEAHTAAGYEIVKITNDLYQASDFTFNGTASASRTDVGTTPMGLTSDMFVNNNDGFDSVVFEIVTDGYVKVDPLAVTVAITGNTDSHVYDSAEHSVSGYTTAISSSLYTENDFAFSGNASAARTEAGTEPMGLKENQFANINESGNFTVSFTVTDGSMTITPVTDEVVVTIVGISDTKTYDGTEHKTEGYTVTSISNPLYTEAGFSFVGAASAAQTNVGSSSMNMAESDFVNTNANFANVKFDITQGTMTITAKAVTVTANDNSKAYGTQDPTLTAVVEGTVGNDTVSYQVARESGELVGTYTINVTGEAEQGNYVVTYVPGTFTITEPSDPTDSDAVVKNHEGGEFDLGEKISFRIRIKNIYNQEATATISEQEGVTILPGNGYTVSEGKATAVMAAGAVITVNAEYTVREADILAKSFKNTAKVTFSVSETEFSDVDTADTAKKKAQLEVTKTSDVEGTAALGDTITYTITVKNIGNVTVSGITVEDELTGNVGEKALVIEEALAPEKSASVTATYVVTEEDIKAGKIVNTAVAHGTDPDSEPTKGEGTKEDPTDTPNPSLAVVKTSDVEGTASLGDTITYTITVTNNGNVTIKDVVVEDKLTGNTGDKALKIGMLAPKAHKDVTVTYVVKEADILAGSIKNVATAKGTDPNGNPTEKDGEVTSNTDPINNKLEVVKTSDVEGTASLGDTITYTITVTNKGNVTVENIAVEDELTGNTGAKALAVGKLAPGESKEVTATYVVEEADILAGSIKNVATATGFDPKGDKTEKTGETEDATAGINNTLKVEKTSAMDGEASLNEVITYTIKVTNDGNVTVKNILVEDKLTNASWTIDALAPKAEKTFTTTYKVTEEDILKGSILNVATAKGTDPNGDPTEGKGQKEDQTDPIDHKISVTKVSNADGAVKLGQTIAYTIIVKNEGNVTVSNVKVTDEKAKVYDKAIEGSIAPGESKSTTVTYTVTEEDVLAGSVLNVATAKGTAPHGDPTEGKGQKEDPTEKQQPSLFVEKTSKMDGTASLGETITYTIKVTNDGNVTIKDIVVEDELTGNTGDKALAVGTLAPGESKKVTAAYVVTEDDILAGSIKNVATAKGTDPSDKPTEKDGTVKDATDDVDTTIEVEKAVKSIGGKTYAEGMKADLDDEIVYTITVTNKGNVTLTNLAVEDELTGNVGENALVIESLAPGDSETVEVQYTVTEADILAGKITNTATVTGDDPDNDPDNDPEGGDDVDVTTEDKDNTITVTKTSVISGEDKVASLGETITYTITVKNEGNVTVSNIKIEDELVGRNGESAWTIDALAPGEEETFNAAYVVTEADILKGSITNTALATGSDPENETTQGGDDVTDKTDDKDNTIIVTKTSVISGEDKVASLGETITYTITVKNDGNVTVNNIMVEDEMTGNVGENAWIIASLAPGATSEPIVVEYTVTEADILKGEILNVATATGTDPEDETTADDGEKEDPTDKTSPSVFVEKTVKSIGGDAEKTTAALGDVIVYTIKVTNNGNLTLTDVVVEDELTGDEITIAELAPKATEEYEVQYTVKEADILAGSIRNFVTVNGNDPDDDPENDPSDDDDIVTPTDDVNNTIEVVKTSDVAEGTTVGLGDRITYTITVTNKGNVTVKDIQVVDELVGLDETIAELAPADQVNEAGQWTTTRTYIVTEEDIVNGTIVNHVTAQGTDPNGEVTGSDYEITDDTDPIDGSYTITKVISNKKSEYKVGDTIQYTITVTNTGNITRHNVVVTDQLTGAAGKVVIAASRDYVVRDNKATIASLAPGETILVNASYKVLADDVNMTIKNAAVAEASDGDPTPDDGENPDPQPTPDVSAVVEKNYTLTIHYQYADGATAAADYTHKYLAGETFRIVSPSIAGYTPNYSAVNSPATGMPAKDLTFTIVYTKNPDPVPPQVTPTEPTTEEETTEEIEETTEEETTEEETVEETTEAPEAVITETDDGSYDLTVIEPEKTPAGSIDLDHKCCILHFLLMLIAMIVLCAYTDKRKKYQKDINDVKLVLTDAGIDVENLDKQGKEGSK